MGLRRVRALRAMRRELAGMDRAADEGDWQGVVAIATGMLEQPSLPGDSMALVQLALGRARFMLGEHEEALAALEHGLRATPPDDVDVRPYRYWAGMAAMAGGDLDRARRHLGIVAEDAAGTGDSFPVGSARRALAQLEAETGRADVAVTILAPMLRDDDVEPMTLSLHAMAAHLAGLVDEAIVSAWLAWSLAASHPDDDDPPAQATIATALVNVAELQVELGHADHAEAVLDEVQRRLELATGLRPGAGRTVPVLWAEVARLQGDLAAADGWLARIDAGPDEPELRGAACRARARLAWARGDDRAAGHYEEAAGIFDDMGYAVRAEAARAEATTGPPTKQPHPPVHELLAGVVEPEDRRDDAVVVVLPLSDDDLGPPGEASSLQDEVQSWEPAVAAAGGELDGWLTGGGELTVYLYGDPDLVWPAIEDRARALAARLGGGHVVRRRNDVETRLPL